MHFAQVNFGVDLIFDVSWTSGATHLALYVMIILFLLLLLAILLTRGYVLWTTDRKINNFEVSGRDYNAQYQRLTRAHANMYENFPLWGGLLLFAIVTKNTEITDSLALYMVGARCAQIVTHCISTSERAVSLRAIFFAIQVMIQVYWLIAFGQRCFT